VKLFYYENSFPYVNLLQRGFGCLAHTYRTVPGTVSKHELQGEISSLMCVQCLMGNKHFHMYLFGGKVVRKPTAISTSDKEKYDIFQKYDKCHIY
jgi:hypothetical protein